VERPYHTIHKKDTRALVQFLTKNGHLDGRTLTLKVVRQRGVLRPPVAL
jgi:hypothetical protein